MKHMPFFNNPVLKVAYPIWRGRLVLSVIGIAFLALVVRAIYLQGFTTEFLQQQGEKRYEVTQPLYASRGKILDRNGVVLAASIPARAIGFTPKHAQTLSAERLKKLAELLDMPEADLKAKIDPEKKTFIYLKRQVPIEVAQQIQKMRVPGVSLHRDNRRYYPEGEVAGNIVGLNTLDDHGQEGVELAFNDQLAGKGGSRRILRDRMGRQIDDVKDIDVAVDGRDIQLSIDTRIQYQVYRALQEAMVTNKAKGAAAVVIDIKSGEILALGNMPTYDPNKRETFRSGNMRNQALTDTFEPGSIMKPFTVALALELNRITPATQFRTGNGKFTYQGATISDVSANGTLDPAGILLKSSNIGMT